MGVSPNIQDNSVQVAAGVFVVMADSSRKKCYLEVLVSDTVSNREGSCSSPVTNDTENAVTRMSHRPALRAMLEEEDWDHQGNVPCSLLKN